MRYRVVNEAGRFVIIDTMQYDADYYSCKVIAEVFSKDDAECICEALNLRVKGN